jgi:deoxyribodipyrimidine photo-lyase
MGTLFSMSTCILWFRQDLRLTDNPALLAAVQSGVPIIPVFILDDENAGNWKYGGATRWWLHHSLKALDSSLKNSIIFKVGRADQILPALAKEFGAEAVFWNRCYEPWRIKRDKAIKSSLTDLGIRTESFNSALLWEPWDVSKQDGTPYKVFTPYYRKGCLPSGEPALPKDKPKTINLHPRQGPSALDDLKLLPHKPEPRWDHKMEQYWKIGEAGAQARLAEFLEAAIDGYKEGRNFPSRDNVSRLSPYLHFGEISPRQVWHDSKRAALEMQKENDLDTFHSELGWREFSHSLLYHFPALPEKPLQSRFEDFPWARLSQATLEKWQKGQTGYPIVDAGMRELWETGYMHNRVRMVVGSFLVKHLRLHWEHGEKWFWDCLVDADLANNAASWQWIAGCGADAAPYFRIFNPVTQGEKFDADGSYVRRWCPEIAKLPDALLHKPWEASPLELKSAGIVLGKTYPAPIVDHKEARELALQAFKATRSGEDEAA